MPARNPKPLDRRTDAERIADERLKAAEMEFQRHDRVHRAVGHGLYAAAHELRGYRYEAPPDKRLNQIADTIEELANELTQHIKSPIDHKRRRRAPA